MPVGSRLDAERRTARAAFLDRDGVLNVAHVREGRPYPPDRIDEVVRVDGIETACARLATAGYLLVVVTNQPDVARGTLSRAEVDAMNAIVTAGLPITDVVVCPHDDSDDCACRKPKPGMLLTAAKRWNIDLSRSVMIGDRWRDIDAGRSAGTTTIYVENGYTDRAPDRPDHVVGSLVAAVDVLLAAEAGG